MSNAQEIKRGVIISYLMIGFNVLSGLIYTPWLLNTVGENSYGLYTLAASIIALFLVDFGIGHAVTRFIAVYRAKDQQMNINRFVVIAIKLYLLIVAVVAVLITVIYANADTIYASLTQEELHKFKTVYIIVAGCVVICFPVNLCDGILRAYEKYVFLNGADAFNKIATMCITAIALHFGGGLYAMVSINGILNIVIFAAKIVFIKKKLPIHFQNDKIQLSQIKSIFSFSAWTTLTILGDQMIFNFMPSILAMVVNASSIALFGFANTIEGYVAMIAGTINSVLLPKVSREVADSKDAADILPFMVRVGRINSSLVNLLLIGIIALGTQFIHLWLGDSFKDLYICILFLIVPYYIFCSQQVAENSVIALNKVKCTGLINFSTGILNLVIAFFLGKQIGVIGVCISICIVYLMRVILRNCVYYKVLHINIGAFFKQCQIKMLPATILALCLALAVSHCAPSNSVMDGWIGLVVKGILICAIYFAVMWIAGWNKDEKKMILNFLKPFCGIASR